MGKKQAPTQSAQHREAISAQRRIVTFLLTFSVVLMAAVVTFSAVQQRDASCQDRAHELLFDVAVAAETPQQEVLSAVEEALRSRQCLADDVPRLPKTWRTSELDTEDGVVSKNGFRLLKLTHGEEFRYELVSVLPALCDNYPSLSMEALANVDYEKLTYHIKALSVANGTRPLYSFTTSLTTRDRNRFGSFTQLRSVFPGFQRVTARGAVVENVLYDTTVVRFVQLYFDGHPMDVTLAVQRWDHRGKPALWRVVLSTLNANAEGDVVSLYHTIHGVFSNRNLLAPSSTKLSDYIR